MSQAGTLLDPQRLDSVDQHVIAVSTQLTWGKIDPRHDEPGHDVDKNRRAASGSDVYTHHLVSLNDVLTTKHIGLAQLSQTDCATYWLSIQILSTDRESNLISSELPLFDSHISLPISSL